MATTQLVSVEEYLHSTYEYDAEYVEGRIIYRPLPKKVHSKTQRYLLRTLDDVGRSLGFEVWPEQRIRTRWEPARFRVPDVCMTQGEPDEEVFTTPPFLCFEILSPDDTAVELLRKVEEYLAFGVEYVWVIDPTTRGGEIHSRDAVRRVEDGVFRAGEIEVDLRKLD